MLEKDEVLRVLRNHLTGSPSEKEIEPIAAEILQLLLGWEEIDLDKHRDEMGFTLRQECSDICYVAEMMEKEGNRLRLFRKVEPP